MIPVDKGHLETSAATHPGEGGANNEDRYVVQAYQIAEVGPAKSVLALVADGVGQQRAGEVAAQVAVETVSKAVAQTAGSQPPAILEAAFLQAGQTILAQSEADAKKRGMSSTCLCAWVIRNRLYAASVGNSCLYLLRKNWLQKLNVVHELVNGEQPNNEETSRGNLGSRQRVDVDLRLVLRPGGEARAERNQGMKLQPNDRLLLCSDGLLDTLKEGEIRIILGECKIEEAADALVRAALDKGAQDNLTAVVLAVPPAKTIARSNRFSLQRVLIRSLVIVLLVLVTLLGWYLWGESLNSNLTPRTTPLATLTSISSDPADSP